MQPTQTENSTIVLYAVDIGNGQYFGGFDAQNNETRKVTNVLTAKLFSNKFDIKLRPNEQIVEVRISVPPQNLSLSDPFRPPRRREVPRHATNVAEPVHG